MYLTEEEAREKVCPMPVAPYCIGSQCMAWRWEMQPKNIQAHPAVQTPERTTRGYCGLARKPG